MRKLFVLMFFVFLCFGVGAVGSVFTASSVNGWYQFLEKPTLTPPASVFLPVWLLLYLMMAVSAWLVWASEHPGKKRALTVFGIQLFFNMLWPAIFFGLRAPGLAVVELVILWGFIVATMMEFRKVRPSAAILLIPYFLWVTFAAFLNYGIWKLN